MYVPPRYDPKTPASFKLTYARLVLLQNYVHDSNKSQRGPPTTNRFKIIVNCFFCFRDIKKGGKRTRKEGVFMKRTKQSTQRRSTFK